MCGICGIILKDHDNPNFSIGALLYRMMESQQVRAQDSAGIAIFNTGDAHCNDLSYNLNYFIKSPPTSMTTTVTGGYELIEEKVVCFEQTTPI